MISLTPTRGTPDWRAAHRGRISASDAHAFMSIPGSVHWEALVRRLYEDFDGTPNHWDEEPEPWEVRHEQGITLGLAAYRARVGPVEPAGMIQSDQMSWLVCSPHGLSQSGCVLIRARLSLRTFYRWRDTVGLSERVKAQLTGWICGKEWCDFYDFWDGMGKVGDRTNRNRVFVNEDWLQAEVLPKLVPVWQEVGARLAGPPKVRMAYEL